MFQADGNYYFDSGNFCIAFKLKLVKSRGYENHKSEDAKQGAQGITKEWCSGQKSGRRYSGSSGCSCNHNFAFLFSNLELTLNNQRIWTSVGFYEHKSYISNTFRGSRFENMGLFSAERKFMKVFQTRKRRTLVWTLFCNKMKILSLQDGSMFYGKMGVDFFSNSNVLYPKMNV